MWMTMMMKSLIFWIESQMVYECDKVNCCLSSSAIINTANDNNVMRDRKSIVNPMKALMVTMFQSLHAHARAIDHLNAHMGIEIAGNNFRAKTTKKTPYDTTCVTDCFELRMVCNGHSMACLPVKC